MSKDDKKYIVTMPHTLSHKVGDLVDLSDEQAKKLVNKVRLRDSIPADKAVESAKALSAAMLELEELKLELEVSKLEIAELKENPKAEKKAGK